MSFDAEFSVGKGPDGFKGTEKQYKKWLKDKKNKDGDKESKSSTDLKELRKEIDNVNYQLQNLEIGLVFISFVLCLFATFFLSKYFRKSKRLLQIILISLLTCSLLTFFYMLFNLLR